MRVRVREGRGSKVARSASSGKRTALVGFGEWFLVAVTAKIGGEDVMPLRDPFHPPVSKRSSCEGFHGGWPMQIVRELGPRLPEGFVAEPRVHLGSYWFRPMAIGQPLPSLPVWLSESQTITLDLDPSYEETCRVLRMA